MASGGTKPARKTPAKSTRGSASRGAASPGHLRFAPIVEALIDIRVERDEQVTVEQLSSMHAAVEKHYPTRKVRRVARGRLDLSNATQAVLTADSRVDGHRFESADGRVIQAQLDGFTFSQLKPYKDWESLRDEAKRMWKIYREIAQPKSVKRVALRYINRISLPVPTGDLADWLLTRPLIGNVQEIADLFMRVVVPLQKDSAFAVITEAIDQHEEPGTVGVILDIDIFRDEAFAVGSKEIWSALERFREAKNHVFFNSITKKTRGMYA